MALTATGQSNPTDTKLAVQDDAGADADNNIFGEDVSVRMVEIDNGGSSTVYVKLYTHASPTIGTTVPNMVLMCPGSVKRSYAFPEGIAFAPAVSMACLTEGGTAGTGAPGGTQKVYVLASPIP